MNQYILAGRFSLYMDDSFCWLSSVSNRAPSNVMQSSVKPFVCCFQTDGSDTVRVSFNLPESRIDRELTATFTLKRPQRQIQLNVKTPWKRFNVEGAIVNDRDLKKASLKAIVDESTEYSVNAELQVCLLFLNMELKTRTTDVMAFYY